jgi:hypothetical protein
VGRRAARDSLAPAPKRQGEDEAAAKRLRDGLASLQSQLTDPATSRTQAIALVDDLAKELRAADEAQAAWGSHGAPTSVEMPVNVAIGRRVIHVPLIAYISIGIIHKKIIKLSGA